MPQIVIVGSGVGGLSFAIALRRQLGFDDFVIYEKASDVGGTWRDNIYPGAASDVSVHFYSLSTDLKPDWPSTHGSQPDMEQYWRQLAVKYNLYKRITFNRLVISAEWSAKEQLYHIVSEDVVTGEKFSTTAKILVSAIGILEVPRFPDIPGLDSYKGAMFHSARWDKAVDLRGKKVGVIGNGASATQFVPIITEDHSVQVTQLCRTPNWLLPPIRADYNASWKWTFKNVWGAMRFYRNLLYLRSELMYLLVFAFGFVRNQYTKNVKDYMKQSAPEKDYDNLIPSFSLGCKRLLPDTNYLACLHRPNMSLNWDGVHSICEDGIITKMGEKLSFDVLIFATGFTADRFPLKVVGDAGKTVQQYYDSQGGPKAYHGTTVPGFPNLFLLAGPNTVTGHTSVILTEELQIDYILQFVKPILSNLVSSFTVTPRATDDYNELIQRRLARSVWVECVSWYRIGGDGKISSIFPGPMMLFAWWLRKPRWSDYVVEAPPTGEWERKVRRERWAEKANPLYYGSLLSGLFVSWVNG
ncbi:hypothetical protein R3P38DRAFT_2959366 [Favolaschia claudopus]|uniref:Flavin-containing monooxygenase n=1 Tax=Favolaschia claudopus TaxID=2862362 RepID=A0AAW0B7S2_9AGAR